MKLWLQIVSCALLVMSCASPQKTPETPPQTLPFLIGTYTTGSSSEGVYAATFDPETGTFGNLRLAAPSMDPSYLVPAGDFVYAVNEQDGGSVSVFKWNASGALDLVETQGSVGVHPCHIAMNSDRSRLAVANYTSGDGAVFPLEDGSLGIPRPYTHEGSGPDPDRQGGPHAHFNTFDSRTNLLYTVDLGTDEINKYTMEEGDGPLESSVAFRMEPGDGPRHLDFHPSQPWAFVLNELSNTIMSFQVASDGTFTPISRLSALPEGFDDYSKAADIHVSPDGNFVYASNRGYHSIAIYRILSDGALQLVGFEKRGIDTPRNFVISEDGQFLLVGNQGSDSIIAFKRDMNTGELSPIGQPLSVGKPVCLKFY